MKTKYKYIGTSLMEVNGTRVKEDDIIEIETNDKKKFYHPLFIKVKSKKKGVKSYEFEN